MAYAAQTDDCAAAPSAPHAPNRAREDAPHLLHVFPNFALGGAQVRFVALAHAWGDQFRHTVLALNGDYPAANLLTPDTRVNLDAPIDIAGGFASRLSAYRKRITALKPDLLVTYNWGSIEVALANMACRVPHLHMEDGFGPEESQHQLPRRVWTRRLALSRSHVVVPSITLRDIAGDVWRLPGNRVHYIPNGVASHARPTASLEQLGLLLPRHRPLIAWVGALRPEKNPLRMLRAFAPLKHDAVLLMIGDGPERASVAAEAERLNLGRNLHILGRRDDARDILMQCQILALSSDTEQMPLVVLEAMDAGLSIASTDVGDVSRMLPAENRPFVVPASDEALSASLRQLLADSGVRARIARANRLHSQSAFSLRQMVQSHRILVEQLTHPGQEGEADA